MARLGSGSRSGAPDGGIVIVIEIEVGIGTGVGESRPPTLSFALLRMTSVRREEIEAALVMGWPLDSVILNAVKNLGAWRG